MIAKYDHIANTGSWKRLICEVVVEWVSCTWIGLGSKTTWLGYNLGVHNHTSYFYNGCN